jgi:hypothetical protein
MKKNNAICMIIFNNPLYLIGACLSAWVHRKFIKEIGIEVKLVVMINEPIIKYKEELEKYFDYIEIIELIEIKLHPDYFVIDKYSEWMKYSISKWKIFNLEQFNKILFIDIDILPINKDFYNVFDYDTIGIIIKGLNEINDGIVRKEIILKDNFIDEFKNKEIESNEYWNLSLKLKKSLDAGFVLIKPDKKIFLEYLDFIKICENNKGYISKNDSGVDETTLLLFLLFYKNLKIHLIPYNYAPIPWEKNPYDKKEIRGINFLSMIKPWVKLPIIQFAEENIWHKIAKKALDKHSIITKLYLKYLIDELYKFYNTWKKNILNKNSPYNMECLKYNNLRHKTFNLFNYLKNNPKEKLSIEQIEYIIGETVKINKYMNKKLIISFDELEYIIKSS